MLKASEFAKGDTAYVLTYWANHKVSIEKKVVDVFKEYVVVDCHWVFNFSDQNAEFHDARFLYEVGELDEPSLLFKEKEEAERYLEKVKTALWLGSMTFDKAMDFSPEQLQKVKEILT